ncbi:NUDIX hydrolase [Corynebacterium uterequi]|uniref:NUDIX family protein n=1 Tax=Corynebacterium uterequi TaxID=1072256 RepID=A0A0G3HGE9_9CORY|nr:CoA pyrophosphatase [Corynebacterium uterequi]AKK10192.1 NUDIX family protein [Corynebacterium uterequi]
MTVRAPFAPSRAPEWLRRLSDRVPAMTPDLAGVLGYDAARAVDPALPAAAVLALFSGDREARTLPSDAGILLTHRNPTMRSHAGQMAFPGGRADPDDDDVLATALREANEETGVDASTITPLAACGPVGVRRSRHRIYPVVGYWERPHAVRANSPAEVDDVFLANLHELIAPENRLMVQWPAGAYRGPAFRCEGYLVWGFTAGVLDVLIRTAGWERPWDRHMALDLPTQLATSRNRERIPGR